MDLGHAIPDVRTNETKMNAEAEEVINNLKAKLDARPMAPFRATSSRR
jgi:hypothetical protein